MSDFGEGKTLKTRKSHRCEWCYERIVAGETCYRYKGMYDGDWQNWYMHPECYEDFRNSGDDEFTPGSAERPKKSLVPCGPFHASCNCDI
jgi:hypothetical protein